MEQLKISELITQLEKVKSEKGDQPVWYHICGEEVGKSMPMQVEGIEIVERSWGDFYVVIY